MEHDASPPSDTDGAPLAGVRIVDLTQYEAGPSATQMLAWMGADVIKIEPPRGEPSRSLAGAGPKRDSIVFALLNQSKRSVVLDLREESGRQTLKALIRQADVLAENFSPGTLGRLGFPADELRSEFPRLIVASIRGYRAGGPWSEFKSLDLVAQAVGGAMSVNGDADGPPMRLGPTVADTGTGLHLAVGILAALVRRGRTGRGGWVEVALQDAMFNFMRNAMIPTYVTGEPAPRTGSAYAGAAPSGLYPCHPGGPNDYVYLLISAGGHWEGVLRTLGREDLIGDARYARQSARNEREDELRELVRGWTLSRDKLEAMRLLSEQGVPCGAVLDTRELLANEQLRQTGMVVAHDHPDWGKIWIPGCPIRMDGFAPRLDPAPRLGADTSEVLDQLRRRP
jgi:formyl-CoA transferase